LAGGYGDIILCPRVSTEIRIEMEPYLQKKRRPLFLDGIEEEAEEEAGEPEDEVVEVAVTDVQATAKKTKFWDSCQEMAFYLSVQGFKT
jgi:hypothetical protein